VNELIYVVDDDKNIRDIISKFLKNEGYRVKTFPEAEPVLPALEEEKPDCIVLDVMLPGISGLDLTKKIRYEYTTPIIFVSAKGEEIDRILGIELGGDDYLVKPFSPRELIVRIKAILRRANMQEDDDNLEEYTLGNTRISSELREFFINDKQVPTTNKEFEMLLYMLKNPDKALSRDQIIENIWGYDYVGETRSVDDLVRRLRKKLRKHDAKISIETIWGYGYKIVKD
jgi:DNA-binding response OmpR family regulator